MTCNACNVISWDVNYGLLGDSCVCENIFAFANLFYINVILVEVD